MTFPKLRFPSLSAFLALFIRSTDVGTIVASVTRQVKDLEAAIDHHLDEAKAHHSAAEDAEAWVAESRALAAEATDDAIRASRVAEKLAALVA